MFCDEILGYLDGLQTVNNFVYSFFLIFEHSRGTAPFEFNGAYFYAELTYRF